MSSNFNISTDYGLFITEKEVIKQIILFYIEKEGLNPSEDGIDVNNATLKQLISFSDFEFNSEYNWLDEDNCSSSIDVTNAFTSFPDVQQEGLLIPIILPVYPTLTTSPFKSDDEVIRYAKNEFEGIIPSELITDEFILDSLSLVEYVYNS